MEDKEKKSLLDRKIPAWHIAYIVLICVIINVFLLLIIPGKVNADAYTNFAFAATITSIVLAVVSIVYSLQSGLSSTSQLSSIKDIENRISEEINKFNGIDEAIRRAVNPLTEDVRGLQKSQNDLQKAQDTMHTELQKYFNSNETIVLNQSDGGTISIVGPAIMYITMYAAIKSKETDMDIPYHKFAEFVGPQARYCEGLLDGIASLHPEKLKISQGSKSSRKKVTVFDTEYLGTLEYWKEKASNIENEKLSKVLLTVIDQYYCNVENQLPPDSVG